MAQLRQCIAIDLTIHVCSPACRCSDAVRVCGDAWADEAAESLLSLSQARPVARAAKQLAAGETFRVVIFGDSISEVGRTPRWHGGASRPNKHWGNLLGRQLEAAYPGVTVDIVHLGIGGQNSYEGLGRVHAVLPQAPGLVFVDMYVAMRAATQAGANWRDCHLGPTNCHPNDRGHVVWAQNIFSVVEQSLKMSGE